MPIAVAAASPKHPLLRSRIIYFPEAEWVRVIVYSHLSLPAAVNNQILTLTSNTASSEYVAVEVREKF